MKVNADRELCIGVGNCVAIAPTVFELDDQNKAVVLDPNSVGEKTLMEAAESCPVNAIIIGVMRVNNYIPEPGKPYRGHINIRRCYSNVTV